MATKKKPPAASDAAPDPAVEKIARESPELILRKQLQAPFPATAIQWKRASDTSPTVYPEVHAAAIMDRLDEVFGVNGWHAEYKRDGDDTYCCLACKRDTLDGGLYVKATALQGDWTKALVLAAQHVGIGRYLARVGPQPIGFKGETPRLPDWALPNTPDDPHPYHGCGKAPKVASDATPKAAEAPKPATDSKAPPVRQETQPPPAATGSQAKADRPADAKGAAKDAKPEPKKAETLDDRLKWWTIQLGECQYPDQATDLLGEHLPKETADHKTAIWKHVLTTIRAAGWEWNAEDKWFYKPQENIPF